ncbi:MAG TPA: M28 family peptidase [Steroidobacteraceae bacterium]|nr:M28 family peptidase [Steroidobacteraceae bacterium]
MHPKRAVRLLAFAGTLLLGACSSTPRGPGAQSQFDDDGFKRFVAAIAAYGFEGRRPGTPGADRAVSYLIAELRLYGLKPANHGSYLQEVPLLSLRNAAAPRLSVARTGGQAQPLRVPADAVLWTPRESGAAELRRSRIVFVGYGIVAPKRGWNDYAHIDVHGATVVALSGEPASWNRGAKGGAERFGLAREKFAQAAAHGAAGILLIHLPAAYADPWAAIVNRYADGLIEAPRPDGHAGSAAIEGWIRAIEARRMFAAAGADFAATVARAARPGFRALPLDLYVDARVRATVRHFTSPNLVAVVPGDGEHRRQYILYGAHWDGLGSGAGRDAGQILPGAVDDASGVAGWLILAQAFAHADRRPDRSIVFLATTAADYGALGARYYLDHPLFPLRDTVAELNLQMLHIGGPTRDVSSLGPMQPPLARYLTTATELQGRVIRPDPQPSRRRFLRSDAAWFAARGVPALYAVGGIDDAAYGPAWGAARLDQYFAKFHDQPGDAYTAAWEVRGTLLDLRLYFETGMALANARRVARP